MKPTQPNHESKPEVPTPRKREDRAGANSEPEKLDFAKLDLSIEKVEERIAPSETNVFDK